MTTDLATGRPQNKDAEQDEESALQAAFKTGRAAPVRPSQK